MKKAHCKKLLMLVAVMLAFACIAAACSPAAASSVKPTESKTESTTESKTESTVVKGDPVVVKYVNRDAKPDTGDYDAAWKAINDLLLENLNCTIEIEFLGSGDKAQMALKYAGNEKFDMSYMATWWGFADNAQSNAFREITMDEIKANMPYMYENLPEIGWKQATINGRILMIPNMRWEYNYNVVAYRGDLLEKYGMSDLKTLDDLEAYLAKVAENEKGMEAFFSDSRVLSMYVYNPNSWINFYSGWLYDANETENPSVFYGVMTDEYMAYAKKMREFQEKGIWAPEAINDTAAGMTKFENGMQSVFLRNVNTASDVGKRLAKTHPEWKIKMFNPSMSATVVTTSFCSNGWGINRNAEHPLEAMQIVDFFYSSVDCQKLLNYGFEGINYEMKDGKVVVLSDVAKDKIHNIGCNWNMGNTLLMDKIDGNPQYDGYEEIMADYKAHTVVNPMQAFNFDKSAVENEVANMAAVDKNYSAIMFGMIEDVEGAIEQWRQDLKDAGYEKVKAEYERQIKEFMASYNK